MGGIAEVVRVRDVVKDFRTGLGLGRRRVLHGISLMVGAGETLAIVGPTGAGDRKSVV